MTSPRNATVIVTGASRGIGLAIARQCLADGFTVVAVSRYVTSDLESLLEQSPTAAYHVSFDLGNIAKLPDLVRSIATEHGVPFGLVNNAAQGLDGLLATQHQSEIESSLRLNLESPIVLSKYVMRHMLRARAGRIINISSIVASTGFSGLSVYAASKAGLEGFTRSLAREAGRTNVTVNAIAPGFVETEMTSSIDGDRLDAIRRRSPLGLARPSDIAGAVGYLLSSSGSHVTGTVLTVDGGSTA
jgi:3-oxoacyl-[acyl-carrier protein] reductase